LSDVSALISLPVFLLPSETLLRTTITLSYRARLRGKRGRRGFLSPRENRPKSRKASPISLPLFRGLPPKRGHWMITSYRIDVGGKWKNGRLIGEH